MPDRRYAILIGTGHYTDSALSALRCPAQDVTGLAAVLGDPALGRFEPVVPLVDQPHEVLLEQTQQTLQQAGRDDTILFYFSGHGITDDQGRLYLAATNTRRRILGGTSLPIEQLKEWFDTYRSTRVIVILDCCFSGAAGHTFAKSTLDDTLQQQLAPGRGKYILTASTATAVAQEKDGDAYSVFTKHLIEGLQSGAADLDHTPDGHITIDALYRYVYSQVRADNGQEPMRWDLNRKGDHMIIAWRRQADHPAAQVAVQAYIDTILQRWQQGEVIPVLGHVPCLYAMVLAVTYHDCRRGRLLTPVPPRPGRCGPGTGPGFRGTHHGRGNDPRGPRAGHRRPSPPHPCARADRGLHRTRSARVYWH